MRFSLNDWYRKRGARQTLYAISRRSTGRPGRKKIHKTNQEKAEEINTKAKQFLTKSKSGVKDEKSGNAITMNQVKEQIQKRECMKFLTMKMN
jgi:hypothetical protein